MSDTVHSITITLERDVHETEAAALCAAVRCLRGVIDATPNVATLDAHVAQVRARIWARKVLNASLDALDTRP